MQNKLLILSFLLILTRANAQTLGGNTVYNFLQLSNTPQLTALGGINISNQTADIGLSFNNPALLRSAMHSQTAMVFNSFYGGIKNYHLMAGFHNEPLKTTFSAGINYFNYGSIAETDIAGNVSGAMRPADYVVQVSAARQYGERGIMALLPNSSIRRMAFTGRRAWQWTWAWLMPIQLICGRRRWLPGTWARS
jgi:hypothetical protein